VIAFVLLGVLQGMMSLSVALAGGGILGVLATSATPAEGALAGTDPPAALA
jgi:hypothetical protein